MLTAREYARKTRKIIQILSIKPHVNIKQSIYKKKHVSIS